ncbi:putative ribonuclease H-like domain-containing protein [Tanacetum coccineum]
MQEELLQFKLQKVWTLVGLPKGKRAIGTKWVYRNKKDERGIVVRNKARLVAQGYTQEEGIDYDEVFAPVARIEAIRLFLAYASFMGLIVYQMDVKSAFLYGTIEEEVYVCQPPSFEDPQFPNKVYKVEKALYGLHQAPKAWYETLSTYLLENGYRRGTIDKNLFIKKDKGDILLVQMSSMRELTFFLGLQVQQKKDGIFIIQDKYVADILKKFDFTIVKAASTPIETNKALNKDEEAEDVDVHLYRSMIGSLMYLTASRPDIMFVVCACARFQVTPKVSHLHAVKRIFRYLKGQPKLGLWYPMDSPFDLEAFSDSDYAGASLDRKSTTGAEYVAAANCCGDSYEKKLVQVIKIHTDHNVADLLTKAFDVSRRHLKLEDSDGITTLPNTKIFEQLALMRVDIPLFPTTLVQGLILQGEGSTVPVESHHTPSGAPTTSQPPLSSPLRIPTRQETKVPQPSSPTYTNVADEAAFISMDVVHGGAATTVSSIDAGQGSGNIPKSPTMPYDIPLLGGHTPGSDEGSMTLHELTVLCTTLSNKVTSEQIESKQNKPMSQMMRRVKGYFQTGEDDKTLIKMQEFPWLLLQRVSTASRIFSTAEESVSTAGASMPVSTAGMVQQVNIIIASSSETIKDKSKAIMQESEQPKKIKKRVQILMSLDEELAQKLHEEEQARFNAEKEAKFNAEQEELLQSETTEDEANPPVADIDWEDKGKDYLQNSLIRERSYKLHSDMRQSEINLKHVSAKKDHVTSFVPIDSVMEKERTKRVGLNLQEESSKRQKTGEGSKPTEELKENEISQEDLQQMIMVVPMEEVYVEAVQVKFPIIDWEVYSKDIRKYWKIIRVGNHTEAYQTFDDMLKKFDRDDLDKLWSLVKERLSSADPTDDQERTLWVELKRLFEPNTDDILWKL